MPLVVRAFPVTKSLDDVRAFAAALKNDWSDDKRADVKAMMETVALA